MPKRVSCDNQYREEINEVLGEVDISEYLYDCEQAQISCQLSHIKETKNQVISFKEIRSPLRSEENNPQTYLNNSRSSSCQFIPTISNLNLDEENNADLLKTVKDKSVKNKLYAKNYRQKKKERLTILEEQNRFLKSKIDDLTFRLKQAQIELNKLKHNHHNNTVNYQTARQALLRQTQKILEKQQSNLEKLLKVQNQLKKINSFDSKHRRDLLNYFMSELLQNLMNDMDIYFLDSLIEKRGLWKENDRVPSRKIDLQVAQILGPQGIEKTLKLVDQLPVIVFDHFINFKNLWKSLYEDYLNIINQGTLIDSLCQSLNQHQDKQNVQQEVLNYLRLQLYFEKIKYRKDMRQLRESWFLENSNDSVKNQQKMNRKSNKKIKLIS